MRLCAAQDDFVLFMARAITYRPNITIVGILAYTSLIAWQLISIHEHSIEVYGNYQSDSFLASWLLLRVRLRLHLVPCLCGAAKAAKRLPLMMVGLWEKH